MEAAHALLKASSGKDVPVKMFLLANMGSKVSSLLTDLLMPKKMSDADVTYDEMKSEIINHLKSQHLVMAERAVFDYANQMDNENAADFFSRLKKLAEHCALKDNLG